MARTLPTEFYPEPKPTMTRKTKPSAFPIPTEKQEQIALFQWARLQRGTFPELSLLFSIPNAGGYGGGYAKNAGRVAGMLKEGVLPGIPDICLPVPTAHHHALYIELKRRKGGSVKATQEAVHQELASYGNRVCICLGWEQARDEIMSYLRGDCQ